MEKHTYIVSNVIGWEESPDSKVVFVAPCECHGQVWYVPEPSLLAHLLSHSDEVEATDTKPNVSYAQWRAVCEQWHQKEMDSMGERK